MKKSIVTLFHCFIAQDKNTIQRFLRFNNEAMKQSNNEFNKRQSGFSSLAFITVLGLFLAVALALIGTGTIKLPGNTQLAVSPIPISDPVEDDESCNDPYNAECDQLDNDPEDLTPAQIQQELEKN